MPDFRTIPPTAITDNVFKLIDKDWMLVTAGTLEHYNTMTASWGHMGIMWNLPVAIAWIRPQRHTFGFAEKYSHYTLSFFTEKYRRPCNSAARIRDGTTIKLPKRGLPRWRPKAAMSSSGKPGWCWNAESCMRTT